jgi:hypothetical protein
MDNIEIIWEVRKLGKPVSPGIEMIPGKIFSSGIVKYKLFYLNLVINMIVFEKEPKTHGNWYNSPCYVGYWSLHFYCVSTLCWPE